MRAFSPFADDLERVAMSKHGGDETRPDSTDSGVYPAESAAAGVGFRRVWLLAIGASGLVVAAVLAFGVFGVHTLFIDETVAEDAPVFASGARSEAATTSGPAEVGSSGSSVPPSTSDPSPEGSAQEARASASGTFEARAHPGSGTVVVLTDGSQSFVRFEEDFSTDNGPDLFVTVTVGDEEVVLAPLKGNVGAQNYELPPEVDPAAISQVAVWCRRFDSTFVAAVMS